MLFAVISVRNSHRREFVFDFFYVFGITVSDDLTVIYRNVTYSVVEIVPGREHVMLHRHKRFGGHVRRSEITRRFAFPVFINLVKSLFGILGNIERVRRAGCDRIEFLFEPFERKFGENLATSRADRRRACDKLAVSYDNRNVIENMLESLRPSHNYRLAFRRFVRFG